MAGPSFGIGRIGPDERQPGTGWATGISLLLSLPRPHLDVEVSGGYARNEYEGRGGGVSTWLASVNVGYRFAAMDALVVPYVLAGAGPYYVEEPDRNAVTAALDAGAGVRVGRGPVRVFAEARYHHAFYSGADARLATVVVGGRYSVIR